MSLKIKLQIISIENYYYYLKVINIKLNTINIKDNFNNFLIS